MYLKKSIIYSLIFLTSLFISFNLLAKKQNQIDSLISVLQIAKTDTAKVNILNDISWKYTNTGNYEQAMQYADEALNQAKIINYKKGIAHAYNNLGIIYVYQGNYEKALENNLNSLKIKEDIGDKIGIAGSLTNIGNIYESQGNYKKALENQLKALKIKEEIDDKQGMSRSYNNIGGLYYNQGNYDKALENHLKSLTIKEEFGDKKGIASSYISIGLVYLAKKDFPKALEYQIKSLEINEQIGNESGKAICNLNIGSVYIQQNKPEEAYQYLDKALTMFKGIGYKNGIKNTYYTLSELFVKNQDYKQAYEYYKQYSDIKDTLLNEASSKQMAEMNIRFESEKKEKQIAISASESKRKNIVIGSSIVVLIITILFSVFLFKRFRIEKKQKRTIESKNKEITDSITYAKHLQNAIMPPLGIIKERLPESFLLYKPKDIVAGDFYWLEEIEEYLFIAAADCTGHGVPGALVSIVCSNALNRSVKEFGLRDTGKILDKATEIVLETFQKSTLEVKDGMDISLLAFNKVNKSLQWSGANNPLWYIENGNLIEIKADKQHIGKSDNRIPFTTHQIKYSENILFYLFTDGYSDQFGGDEGKKFKIAQLKELILANYLKPMNEQNEILDSKFEKWKGKEEQVDDILIIGAIINTNVI